MTTLDLIVALIAALHHDDVAATGRLLDALEARMGPEELADLLEAILAAVPPTTAGTPALAACA